MKTKFVLLFVLVVFAIFFSGCQSNYDSTLLEEDSIENDYLKIAQFYVTNSYAYKNHEGDNLVLVFSEELQGVNSYKFYLRFDIKDNKNLPSSVVGYQMNIPVRGGEIHEVEILEITHDVAEILNISCESNLDCAVPYNYALQSNCPYQSLCMQGKCTVICPSFNGKISFEKHDESQMMAKEIAKKYIMSLESYHKYNARNLEVTKLEVVKCIGCYNVYLEYEIDSFKDVNVTDVATASVSMRNWQVVDSVLSQGSKEEMSIDKVLYIAQNSDCIEAGQLTTEYFYNNETKSWWIELNADKGVCNPVCVVDEVTRTAKISIRC